MSQQLSDEESRTLAPDKGSDEPGGLVYGIHPVEALLATRMESIDHLYFDKDKRSATLFNLIKLCRKERLVYNLVPSVKLDYIAGTKNHQGVAALCSVKSYCSPQDLKSLLAKKTAPLLVVAASIEDPGNLGSIIRSCVALGVDALLLERKNTAPLSPVVAKTSAGMVEHLPIVRPKNLEGLLKEFVASGYRAIGTHAEKGQKPGSIDFKGPSIIILGGEHRGLPPYLMRLCTDFLSVPMAPNAQSLNVSAATAIMLYECLRQRDFAY